jgi:hypothetical protein
MVAVLSLNFPETAQMHALASTAKIVKIGVAVL